MSHANIPKDRLSRVTKAPLNSQAKQVVDAHRTELSASPLPNDDGLPAWMTSKTMIVSSILISAVAISYFHTTVLNAARDKSRQEVREGSCLKMPSLAGNAPMRRWPDNDDERMSHTRIRNGVTAAGGLCQPGDCPKKALEAYEWALSKYLRSRITSLTLSYKTSGSRGTDLVNEFYSGASDYNVIMDARAKVKAGLIDVDKQGEPERSLVLRLLLANPTSPIPICRG